METDTNSTSDTIANRPAPSAVAAEHVWLTVREAGDRARCGVKLIYREVAAGRLRAAHIGGRRELRIKPQWIDDCLMAQATIQ